MGQHNVYEIQPEICVCVCVCVCVCGQKLVCETDMGSIMGTALLGKSEEKQYQFTTS